MAVYIQTIDIDCYKRSAELHTIGALDNSWPPNLELHRSQQKNPSHTVGFTENYSYHIRGRSPSPKIKMHRYQTRLTTSSHNNTSINSSGSNIESTEMDEISMANHSLGYQCT